MTRRTVNFTVYADYDALRWQTETFTIDDDDVDEFVYARVAEIVGVLADCDNEGAEAEAAAERALLRPPGVRIPFAGGWLTVNLPSLPTPPA